MESRARTRERSINHIVKGPFEDGEMKNTPRSFIIVAALTEY
jgi:hypothetical protein